MQGKELTHFLTLFKGRFVIHKGGIEGGFKNRQKFESYDANGRRCSSDV